MFDYTIIGAGPCGLTLALYLSKLNKKVLIIDKEDSIGGCHRVRRVNGLFTEHGPRIIGSSYLSLVDILTIFDKRFDEVYVQYDYNISASIISVLNYWEIFGIVIEFFKFILDENQSRNITMQEFTKKYNFTEISANYIDNLCRLIDGGHLSNFTLYEFLQIFNQNYFYKLYQPRLPNDIGLFKYWKDTLDKSGNVTLLLNTEINSIVTIQDKIQHIVTKNNIKIESTNYIFAIPPGPMMHIIQNSTNQDMFGKFDELIKWTDKSNYQVYLPIIFHWSSIVPLKKIWGGVTNTDYSLVYIVMSDYMDFQDVRSKTVITCTVKMLDRKSSINGKTANECTEEELIHEVFRQLKQVQPDLPEASYSIISPGVYKKDGKWLSHDTAYFYTKAGYKSSRSLYNNLYWVGTHNGESVCSFTSMESAIENAINLLYEIEPETRNKVIIHSVITIKNVIRLIFIIMFFVLIYVTLM